jgi:hypothetical protein
MSTIHYLIEQLCYEKKIFLMSYIKNFHTYLILILIFIQKSNKKTITLYFTFIK